MKTLQCKYTSLLESILVQEQRLVTYFSNKLYVNLSESDHITKVVKIHIYMKYHLWATNSYASL